MGISMKHSKILYIPLCLLFLCFLLLPGGRTSAATANALLKSSSDTSGFVPVTGNEKHILFSENQEFAYYLNTDSLSVSIQDKNMQNTWTSDREPNNEGSINELWVNRIMSGITLEYYDKKLKKAGYATVTGDKCNIDLYQGENAILANITFTELSISLTLRLTALENQLVAQIPFHSLEEGTGYLIKTISIFPFLGSTNETQTDGYILVPEGSGVLMEYASHKTAIKSAYKAKVYGSDSGLNDSVSNSYTLTLPLYGIVNGIDKNAFYTHIGSGSAYAELNVYPSGVTTKYNWATYIYSYRQNFFQPTASDGTGYMDLEQDMNTFDISVTYTFLNDADANYTGIAKDYQSKLVEQGILTKNTGNSFLHLEFLGAEIYKTMLGYKTNLYTTVKDVSIIVNDLSEQGILPVITYSGTSKNGRSGNMPNKFPLESKLGSMKEFKALFTELKNQGIPIYLAADYMYARTDKSGFNKKKDLLRKVDQKLLINTYEYRNYSLEIGVLSLDKINRLFQEDLNNYKKSNMDIVIENLGGKLYSDYGTNQKNREESLTYAAGIFDTKEIKTAFYAPNEYFFSCMDRYFSIPLGGSGYLHFTKDVPFLQIVLKGYVDYYSPWQNTSPNPKEDLLRMIEYGVYPAFIITWQPPYDLSNTPSDGIFSSEYALWRNKIIETEKVIREVFYNLTDAHITDHSNDGTLAITTYDNGAKIYVNYSENEILIGRQTLAAQSYHVEGFTK